MDLYELGSSLFGRSRAEDDNVLTDATTRTYIGTATSDSSDGSVYVALSEDVTMPDDYDGEHGVGVEMPTTVGVSEGDDVVVTVFGGGTMKAPVVTGNPGWGDAVQEQVNNAETLAEQAEAVASATGQHFWPGTDGVHVTEVTQTEWNDSEGASYHSGANVLLNSLGQLFRNGLNNLLALVGGTNPGVAIYDGAGNDAENIVAMFTGDGIGLVGDAFRLTSAEHTETWGSDADPIELSVTESTMHMESASDAYTIHSRVDTRVELEDGTTGHTAYNSGYLYAGVVVEDENGLPVKQPQLEIQSTPTRSDARLVADNIEVVADGSMTVSGSTVQLITGSTNQTVVNVPNRAGTIALTSDVPSVTTATLTRGSAASSWATGEVRKYGHVVSVCINDLALTAQLASGATSGTITTIPAGYRPPRTARFNVPIQYKGTWANVWAAIGTGGNVVIVNDSDYAIPAGRLFSFTHTYIVS